MRYLDFSAADSVMRRITFRFFYQEGEAEGEGGDGSGDDDCVVESW